MNTLPLSREQIEAIQARAEKASPGPWFANERTLGIETKDGYDIPDTDADNEFLAESRADIPALCQQALRAIELEAEVTRCRAETNALRPQLEKIRTAFASGAAHVWTGRNCPHCHGTGINDPNYDTASCLACGGTGEENLSRSDILSARVEELNAVAELTTIATVKRVKELEDELTATRNALEEATADACDEEIVAAITEEPMATRTPSRIVHYLKKHGLKIVRALPSPQVKP